MSEFICAREGCESFTYSVLCHRHAADNVVKLAPRKPRKRLERNIVAEIRSAIGRLPWAVVWRNNTGSLPDARGIPIKFGLCEGSADLIGIVTVDFGDEYHQANGVGRFFALEVKQPGKEPTEIQEQYLAVVRARNGAAACVTSVEEALAFLEKARRLEV